MASEHDSDMIMYFSAKPNAVNAVYAECAMEVYPKQDDLVRGFVSADYDTYSNFFQVSKFEFGIEVKDEDTKNAQNGRGGQQQGAHGRQQTHAPQNSAHGGRGGPGGQPGAQKQKASFESWRAGKMGDKAATIYPAMPDTFSFTRLIDRASIEFFDAVCNIRSYEEAVLVKRIFVGNESPKMGILRIEFSKVLITNLDWDDGDMLTESCKFICQKFAIQYRPQANDGSLGKPIPTLWDYKIHAQPPGA